MLDPSRSEAGDNVRQSPVRGVLKIGDHEVGAETAVWHCQLVDSIAELLALVSAGTVTNVQRTKPTIIIAQESVIAVPAVSSTKMPPYTTPSRMPLSWKPERRTCSPGSVGFLLTPK